ncbi:MAG: hypothetical protein GF334_00140 [Candidatus Altiarchaeales archaeon]|nr:hypothetical protein [Candidatus Altiarchaeales archaeon]
MAFPISPTDGQEYQTAFGSRYKYYASDAKWVKIGFYPTGQQGETGIRGDTGVQGETGSIGLTGAQGEVGGYTGVINFVVEGGSSAVSSGTKGNLTMPFDLQLNDWRVMAEETGTIYFNIYEGTYNDYPPSTKMHAGMTGPHIISGIKNQDLDISDWSSTSLSRGGLLRVEVDGSQSITNATLSFNFNKT